MSFFYTQQNNYHKTLVINTKSMIKENQLKQENNMKKSI